MQVPSPFFCTTCKGIFFFFLSVFVFSQGQIAGTLLCGLGNFTTFGIFFIQTIQGLNQAYLFFSPDILFVYIFNYFWLCLSLLLGWLFSSCHAQASHGGVSLVLQSTSSRPGFQQQLLVLWLQSTDSRVVVHHSMWDLPRTRN